MSQPSEKKRKVGLEEAASRAEPSQSTESVDMEEEEDNLPEYAKRKEVSSQVGKAQNFTGKQAKEREELEKELEDVRLRELKESEKEELLKDEKEYVLNLMVENPKTGEPEIYGQGPTFADVEFAIPAEQRENDETQFHRAVLAREHEINKQRFNYLVSMRKKERF